MRRSLNYFWRIQLAVLLGAAVATAVLTGALLVGDSVRGSLRGLTLDRLGRIDYALVSEHFFREGLVTDLSNKLEGEAQFHRETVPAILLNGTAVNAKTKARASRVQIQGIDEQFTRLWEDASRQPVPSLEKQPGQLFSSVHINQSLQNELDIKAGEQLLLSFERHSEVHREFLLGHRDSSEGPSNPPTHRHENPSRPWYWQLWLASQSKPSTECLCSSFRFANSPRKWEGQRYFRFCCISQPI